MSPPIPNNQFENLLKSWKKNRQTYKQNDANDVSLGALRVTEKPACAVTSLHVLTGRRADVSAQV